MNFPLLLGFVCLFHEHTRIANLVYWKDKPVALSIVQARLVGLAHFSIGYVLTRMFWLESNGRVVNTWAVGTGVELSDASSRRWAKLALR